MTCIKKERDGRFCVRDTVKLFMLVFSGKFSCL